MMIGLSKKKRYLETAVILFLLALPYYLFKGQLFIGGDDSRLLYVFPKQFLQQVALTSWLHFSSAGSYSPNYFLIPLLLVVWASQLLIHNQIIVFYMAYSMPIILGFIFFRKFMRSLISDESIGDTELTVFALVYALSPILIVDQLAVFLYAAWLVALMPLLLYYWFQYQETGNLFFLVLGSAWSFLFALAFFSIPWLLGLLLPLSIGVLAVLFVKKGIALIRIKRFTIFGLSLVFTQFFWFLPFVYSFKSGFAAQASGGNASSTFAPIVKATAIGNIFDSLVNLPHRQIAFSFNWSLKRTFLTFYDKVSFLDLFLLLILLAGISLSRKYLTPKERNFHLVFLISFLISLFLFTVDIAPFTQLFIDLGAIPGFAMFRNAFDKFAPGYVFIYSVLLSFSIVVIIRAMAAYSVLKKVFLSIVFIIILLNALPIRQIIVHPLWSTNKVKTTTTIPSGYLSFMRTVKQKVPPSTNILSLPFGVASYTFIPNQKTGGVYVGRSPVQLLSGVNDFSGNFSFSANQAKIFDSLLVGGKYSKLRAFLKIYNINYMILTKNIPPSIFKSYLFSKELVKAQNGTFYNAIKGKKIAQSPHGDYVLYKLKSAGKLIYTPRKLETIPYAVNPNGTSSSEMKAILVTIEQGGALVPSKLDSTYSNKTYIFNPGNRVKIPRGSYLLRSNHPLVGTLTYNKKSGQLILDYNISYKIGKLIYPQSKKVLAIIHPNAVISINGIPSVAQNINGQAVHNGEKMIIGSLSSKRSVLIDIPSAFSQQINIQRGKDFALLVNTINETGTLNRFSSWSQGDCHSVSNGISEATKFSFPKQSEAVLRSKPGHNACLMRDVNVNPYRDYRLKFNYKSSTMGGNLGASIVIPQSGVIKEYNLTSNTRGGWKHFAKVFSLPSNTHRITIYLYSGSNDLKSSMAAYKQLSLSSYAANYHNVIVTQKKPTAYLSSPRELSVINSGPIYDKVAVKGATGPFLLALAQSFNPGWKLYLQPLSKNASSSNNLGINLLEQPYIFNNKHVKINAYDNGWWVNPNFIKRHYGPSYYHQNSNGSIDFNLVVYFQPQFYFYIGSLVSVLSFVIIIGFWRFQIKQRRREIIGEYGE